MSNTTDTSRRSFLKVGALAAVPVAAVALPVAAMASDGSKAALARLQDERAIEALTRDFLRAFNRGGAKGAAQLFAGGKAPVLGAGISSLAMDAGELPEGFSISDDGATASARYPCMVETAEELEGSETIVQMARQQGNSAVTHKSRKVLSARYARLGDTWRIASVELA